MSEVKSFNRARIATRDGRVWIVTNAKQVAKGWAFNHDRTVPALEAERFQSSTKFLPLKQVVSVEEMPSRVLVGQS